MSQWLLVKSISLSLNLNNFKCLRAPIWLKYKRHMTTCACTVWRLTAAACCFACKLVCAVTTGRKEKSESVITLYELQAVIVVTSAVYIACLWLYLQQLWSANNHLCCQTNLPQQGGCMQRGRPSWYQEHRSSVQPLIGEPQARCRLLHGWRDARLKEPHRSSRISSTVWANHSFKVLMKQQCYSLCLKGAQKQTSLQLVFFIYPKS